jgi:NAD(P)-dependent dehydrogenase (short-subunit alcohol dehydrogenase family)
MAQLAGSVVLVTGANGGLGTQFVRQALERGAGRVYATARKPGEWDDNRVVPLALDVTDPESVAAAATSAADATIVINNAGASGPRSLLASSLEEVRLRLELAAQGTQVTGAHLGYTDTPMIAALDVPKSDPGDIVAVIYDGLEAGELEILADDTSRRVKQALSQPLAALYPQVAAVNAS